MTKHPYPTAYLAGPWFTPEQARRLDLIRNIMEDEGVDFYDPMKDCLYVHGKTTPEQVLAMNVDAINARDFIVVITDGKDTGTIFEAGYAYAIKKPIIYVWLTGASDQKFNLMLGASGAVVRSGGQLINAIRGFKEHGQIGIKIHKDIQYE